MISFDDAALIIANRPDILPFYQQNGWDISQSNWVAIITNWWTITTEKDEWGGDIQQYLAYLRGTAPGAGIIPGLPSLDLRTIALLAAGAVVVAMVFSR